jgi:formate hydrogenlyase subunit 3/multisubunit Na+/H+ antiporter MnhD subunit
VPDSVVNLRRSTADFVEVHYLLPSAALVAVAILAATALAAVVRSRSNRAVVAVGSAGALGASTLGLVAALVALIPGLGAWYGIGYLRGYRNQRRLWPAVVGFNVLEAAMLLVVLARDGVGFLVAWEVMSLASFFLVTFESERDGVPLLLFGSRCSPGSVGSIGSGGYGFTRSRASDRRRQLWAGPLRCVPQAGGSASGA